MRWTATIYYRTEHGTIDVEHRFDEIEELQIIVERGPSWYAIDRLEIRTTVQTGQTIEQTLVE